MALLSRGRPPSSEKHHGADGRMSIVEHLEDLRRCLIISAIGWLVTTIVAFVFWQRILDLLIARAGLQRTGVYFTHPAGAFTLGLTIALVVGLIASAPIIFWQAWTFVSPGLHEHERRLALPLIVATSFFFLLGIAFALFSLPLFIRVLTGFAPLDVHYLPLGDELLGFILLITIAFGIVFELPVVLYTLGMLRIISARWLYRHRLYWMVALGLAANFMTPGADPLTPLLVFVPLYIFWEGTTLLLKLTGH
ncbi:MAG: twin-arginine translocase subunit TatC [Chloroflexi bacterium]|nr:MAG: twin-arginine translocase subunit TatC [Chloroflexota bacterium]